MSEEAVYTPLWENDCPEGSALLVANQVDPETGEKTMVVTCYDQSPVPEPHTVTGVLGLTIGTHVEQYRFEATYTPGEVDLADVAIVEELTP